MASKEYKMEIEDTRKNYIYANFESIMHNTTNGYLTKEEEKQIEGLEEDANIEVSTLNLEIEKIEAKILTARSIPLKRSLEQQVKEYKNIIKSRIKAKDEEIKEIHNAAEERMWDSLMEEYSPKEIEVAKFLKNIEDEKIENIDKEIESIREEVEKINVQNDELRQKIEESNDLTIRTAYENIIESNNEKIEKYNIEINEKEAQKAYTPYEKLNMSESAIEISKAHVEEYKMAIKEYSDILENDSSLTQVQRKEYKSEIQRLNSKIKENESRIEILPSMMDDKSTANNLASYRDILYQAYGNVKDKAVEAIVNMELSDSEGKQLEKEYNLYINMLARSTELTDEERANYIHIIDRLDKEIASKKFEEFMRSKIKTKEDTKETEQSEVKNEEAKEQEVRQPEVKNEEVKEQEVRQPEVKNEEVKEQKTIQHEEQTEVRKEETKKTKVVELEENEREAIKIFNLQFIIKTIESSNLSEEQTIKFLNSPAIKKIHGINKLVKGGKEIDVNLDIIKKFTQCAQDKYQGKDFEKITDRKQEALKGLSIAQCMNQIYKVDIESVQKIQRITGQQPEKTKYNSFSKQLDKLVKYSKVVGKENNLDQVAMEVKDELIGSLEDKDKREILIKEKAKVNSDELFNSYITYVKKVSELTYKAPLEEMLYALQINPEEMKKGKEGEAKIALAAKKFIENEDNKEMHEKYISLLSAININKVTPLTEFLNLNIEDVEEFKKDSSLTAGTARERRKLIKKANREIKKLKNHPDIKDKGFEDLDINNITKIFNEYKETGHTYSTCSRAMEKLNFALSGRKEFDVAYEKIQKEIEEGLSYEDAIRKLNYEAFHKETKDGVTRSNFKKAVDAIDIQFGGKVLKLYGDFTIDADKLSPNMTSIERGAEDIIYRINEFPKQYEKEIMESEIMAKCVVNCGVAGANISKEFIEERSLIINNKEIDETKENEIDSTLESMSNEELEAVANEKQDEETKGQEEMEQE